MSVSKYVSYHYKIVVIKKPFIKFDTKSKSSKCFKMTISVIGNCSNMMLNKKKKQVKKYIIDSILQTPIWLHMNSKSKKIVSLKR